MHPDYIGQTKRGKTPDPRRSSTWGDSDQDKEFEEPEGSNANASQAYVIETTGKYPYLVTQMESDGEDNNFVGRLSSPG